MAVFRTLGVLSFSLELDTGLVTWLARPEFESDELARLCTAVRAREEGMEVGGGLATASFRAVGVAAEEVADVFPAREDVLLASEPRGLAAEDVAVLLIAEADSEEIGFEVLRACAAVREPAAVLAGGVIDSAADMVPNSEGALDPVETSDMTLAGREEPTNDSRLAGRTLADDLVGAGVAPTVPLTAIERFI